MTDHGGTLQRRVLESLLGPILSGDWPPGTYVPSEAELARTLVASRSTVTRVTQQLRQFGFLVGRKGGTTWVAPAEALAWATIAWQSAEHARELNTRRNDG